MLRSRKTGRQTDERNTYSHKKAAACIAGREREMGCDIIMPKSRKADGQRDR